MKVTSMIIGVTTLADNEEERKAFMEAGLNHCLAKPLSKAKILPLINNLMDAWWMDELSPLRIYII